MWVCLLFLLVPGISAIPCADSRGRTFRDGTYYFEDPTTQCIINKCVYGQEILQKDKCASTGSDPRTCTGYDGTTYTEGQTWFETAQKPCTQYECRSGTKTIVHTVSCPSNPLCTGSNEVAGNCCPVQIFCGCTSDGVTRRNGERWSDPRDPCLMMLCVEGEVTEFRTQPQPQPCPGPPQPDCQPLPPTGGCTCTEYTCPRPGSTSNGCFYDNVYRAHGSSWRISDCVIGRCEDGTVREASFCPPLPAGCRPVYTPGECCPTCASSSCTFGNRTYQHNETWGDECEAHYCDNGKVISQYADCPKAPKATCAGILGTGCCVRWSCDQTQFDGFCTGSSGTQMICYRPGPHEGECSKTTQVVPGGCCNVYDCARGCTDANGVHHPHGSSWQEGCQHHSCHNGEILTAIIDCAPPQNEHCRRTNPDECCPIHDCSCQHNGQTYSNFAVWTAHCQTHRCVDGRVESTAQQCPPPPREGCRLPQHSEECCPPYICSCALVLCQAPPPGCTPVGKTPDGCCDVFRCRGDCRDDENRVHRDGSEWYVKCSKYRCSGGVITELPTSCPEPPSADCTSRFLPGKCCPLYDCPKPECTPGDSTFDGCNTCQCVFPGHLVCTLKYCENRGCTDQSGKTRQHGETWTDEASPCLEYRCAYGTILSSMVVCPPAPGPLCAAIPEPGHCCPEWACLGKPCPSSYTDVTWEDDCNICTCSNGVPICTEHICPKPCQVGGTKIESGESFLGNGTCEEYTCINGVPLSQKALCSTPPPFDCKPSGLDTGDCCPSWTCTHVPTFSKPCTQGEIYQDEEDCVFCQCRMHPDLGVLKPFCTKMDCREAWCRDPDDQVEHYHGDVWATVNPCKQRACVSGQVQEMVTRCNPPPSTECRKIPDSKRCCPLYDCSPACEEGSTFKVDCNDCFCQNGLPLCTKRLCPECIEGETTTVDCNNCTCIDGRNVCTEIACPPSGTCPVSVSVLVAPHLHPSRTPCTSASDCRGENVGCCRGYCTTLDNKPGTCPPPDPSHPVSTCQFRPGVNCISDGQCPADYKCCPQGCGSLCVHPGTGHVLRT